MGFDIECFKNEWVARCSLQEISSIEKAIFIGVHQCSSVAKNLFSVKGPSGEKNKNLPPMDTDEIWLNDPHLRSQSFHGTNGCIDPSTRRSTERGPGETRIGEAGIFAALGS